MATETNDTTTGTPSESTQTKRAPTVVLNSDPKRKPPTRSNEKSATDILLDEGRIGRATTYPSKKRRYIALKFPSMMAKLTELYGFLFNYRWQFFRHLAPQGNVTARTHATNFAKVYLSHWISDLYRMNRLCLESIDPAAFQDKYATQVGTYSNVYDNFLSTLNAHIRPTHVVNAVSDCIYIPIFTKTHPTTGAQSYDWTDYTVDANLFHSIIEIMSEKKILKMTPISSDLLGRPSWLFDWSNDNKAYAWFPQENNFSDTDVAVAYIIGEACSPKLSLADIDDWKYTDILPNLDNPSVLASYNRVTPRRWYGNSEFRTFEIETVHVPDYTETDAAKKRDDNHGPLQLVAKITDSLAKQGASTSTSTDQDEIVTDTDTLTVPSSPAYNTRTRTQAAPTTSTVYRVRITDRLYYSQVILTSETSTRHTAFKLFNRYE